MPFDLIYQCTLLIQQIPLHLNFVCLQEIQSLDPKEIMPMSHISVPFTAPVFIQKLKLRFHLKKLHGEF